jgi:hypothetical protein
MINMVNVVRDTRGALEGGDQALGEDSGVSRGTSNDKQGSGSSNGASALDKEAEGIALGVGVIERNRKIGAFRCLLTQIY